MDILKLKRDQYDANNNNITLNSFKRNVKKCQINFCSAW